MNTRWPFLHYACTAPRSAAAPTGRGLLERPVMARMLSDTLIATALKQAQALGCPPTGNRCAVWPNTAERVVETLNADGWCVIGGVEDVRSHGPRWRALLHIDTGEVRLERE